MTKVSVPNVLSIAGTDPTGGAGIQADLKTFSALGAYGMTVITALVAQNTAGVKAVQEVPAEFVTAQLDAVFSDVRVDAVKIGMLANTEIIRAVAHALARYQPPYVVLDPVMVAKSGDRLLDTQAIVTLRDELLPWVDVVTPNVPEAAELLNEPEATTEVELRDQLERLAKLGARQVLLKGGHLTGAQSVDFLLSEGRIYRLVAERVSTINDHGTGCTLSAAMAALRPQRSDWGQAIRDAKDYLTSALNAADQLNVGHGHGPVHHFYSLWQK